MPITPNELIWEIEGDDIAEISKLGIIKGKKAGQSVLIVSTPDKSVISRYPFQVFDRDDFIVDSDAVSSLLSEQAAPGHSYQELNQNWGNYIGRSLNLYGNYCNPKKDSGADCGECTGFAKAFGNNVSPAKNTKSWFRGTALLTRGYNPTVKSGIVAGDAVATMEYLNGAWKYSLSDYRGEGHVLLFARAYNNGIFVREQNWDTPHKVGSRISYIPTINGKPYCSNRTTTDVSNICNYYKVVVR